VSELLKSVVPVPLLVELLAVVGAVDVFQTTPFAEMLPPPALIVLPPELAEELVIALAAVVVTLAVATAVAEAVGAEVVR